MRTHRPGCVAARSIWIAGLIALISLGSLSAQPVPAAAAFDDVIFLATGTGPYHFEVLDNDLLATGILSYESPKHGTLELNGGTFTYRPSTGWFDERVVDSFTYVVTYPAALSEEQTIIAKATVILMHEDRRVFEDGAESGLPPGWADGNMMVSEQAALHGAAGFEAAIGEPFVPDVAEPILGSWLPGGNNQNNDGTMMVTTIDGCEALMLPSGALDFFALEEPNGRRILRLKLRHETDDTRSLRLRIRDRMGFWQETDWIGLPAAAAQVAVNWWPESGYFGTQGGAALRVNGQLVAVLQDSAVRPFFDYSFRLGAWGVGGTPSGFVALDNVTVARWPISEMLEHGPFLNVIGRDSVW